MANTLDGLRPADATRIVLRPLASPLPLGFLALFVASLLASALQLHWVPVTADHGYELTSAPGWRYAAGVCGIVVAGLALYAALASELDSATRRSLLPMLRPAAGQRAVSGRLTDQVTSLGREPGVRQ